MTDENKINCANTIMERTWHRWSDNNKLNIVFFLLACLRNIRSNQWQFSRLKWVVLVEPIHGEWLAVLFSCVVITSSWRLSKKKIFVAQPNLSASWLFQRAMSAKQQANVSPEFINELLYVNFQSMQVRFNYYGTNCKSIPSGWTCYHFMYSCCFVVYE